MAFNKTPEVAGRGKPGQCRPCGAFRVDGAPPTVHFAGCVGGPSGRQIGPIEVPLPEWHGKQSKANRHGW